MDNIPTYKVYDIYCDRLFNKIGDNFVYPGPTNSNGQNCVSQMPIKPTIFIWIQLSKNMKDNQKVYITALLNNSIDIMLNTCFFNKYILAFSYDERFREDNTEHIY